MFVKNMYHYFGVFEKEIVSLLILDFHILDFVFSLFDLGFSFHFSTSTDWNPDWNSGWDSDWNSDCLILGVVSTSDWNPDWNSDFHILDFVFSLFDLGCSFNVATAYQTAAVVNTDVRLRTGAFTFTVV